MDTDLPPPSKIRFFDILNFFVLLISIVLFAFLTQQPPSVFREFGINITAGLILIPFLYAIPRIIFHDRTKPYVQEYFEDGEEVYVRATAIVTRRVLASIGRRRVVVRIFAPVGLGVESEEKDRWLKKLAQHASDRKIRLQAVWALPSVKEPPIFSLCRLLWFVDKPSCEVRVFPTITYQGTQIPVVPVSGTPITLTPGFGMIIVDDDLALFGFSPYRESDAPTHGFVLYGRKAIKHIIQWFESHICDEHYSMQVFANRRNGINIGANEKALERLFLSSYPDLGREQIDSYFAHCQESLEEV